MHNNQVINFENGLRLLYIHNNQNTLAYIQAYVKTGSIHEYPHLGSGLSHFLEHMIAGQATQSYSLQKLNFLLNLCGGMYNAYTTYDHTNFHINTQNETLEQAIDIILEWLFFPAFQPKVFKQEKEIILREIEKNNSSIEQQFYEKTQQNFYQSHPIRIPIIGYEDLFKKITMDQLKTYYNKTYTPDQILISVTTSESIDKIMKQIKEKQLPHSSMKDLNKLFFQSLENNYKKSDSLVYQKTAHSRLSIRFKSVDIFHPDRVIIDMLCHILGNGQESILQEELLFKNQDCFEINIDHSSHHEAKNYIEIYANCKPEKLNLCYENCKQTIEKLITKGLTLSALEKAKNQKKSEYYSLLENIEDYSNQLSFDIFYTQDPTFSQRYYKSCQHVNLKELKNVLINYFKFDQASVSISHPVENKNKRATKQVINNNKIYEEKIVLENGLSLLLSKDTKQALTHINCMHLGGLYAEKKDKNGVAYLCADLLGNKSKHYNKKQLIGEFEKNGAQYYSASGQHIYHHNLICLNKNNQSLIPLFWDSIVNAEFAEKDLIESKEIQKQYIYERENAWHTKGFYEFKKFFYQNHIYSNSLLGEIDKINKINHLDCKHYHDQMLNPKNMIVSILGNFSDKDLNQTIQILSSLKQQKTLKEYENIKHNKSNELMCHTHLNIASIFIGFNGTRFQDEEANLYYTLISCILTGMSYPSGRLFNDLREKGYVYQANGGHHPGLNNGHLLFYALTNINQVQKTKDCMLEHINDLIQKTISDSEIEACKAQMKFFYKEKESKIQQSLISKAFNELIGLKSNYNQQMIRKIDHLDKKTLKSYCKELQNPQILIIKKH